MQTIILLIHILSATIWVGGFLMLSISTLPKTLKNRSNENIAQLKTDYNKISIHILILQLLTGLWLAYNIVPDIASWFSFKIVFSHLIVGKLSLLVITFLLAIYGRTKIIPKLNEKSINSLAINIIIITLLSIGFVFIGMMFKTGGAI